MKKYRNADITDFDGCNEIVAPQQIICFLFKMGDYILTIWLKKQTNKKKHKAKKTYLSFVFTSLYLWKQCKIVF